MKTLQTFAEALRRYPFALPLVVLLALAGCVTYAGATILGSSDSLTADVRTVVSRMACSDRRGAMEVSEGGGFLITHRCPPPGSEVGDGVFGALAVLLLGGVPATLLGLGLVVYSQIRRKLWSPAWAQIFMAGFLFQVSSVAVTTVVLAAVVYGAVGPSQLSGSEIALAGALAFAVAIGAAGLRCWRSLCLSVVNPPISISVAGGAAR